MTSGWVSMASNMAVKVLRTPCEVVLDVVALSPLRHSGHVIRIVLIADDPDDLATIELEALAQNLDQKVGDIVPAARLGKELVGDQGTHYRIPFPFSCWLLLVAARRRRSGWEWSPRRTGLKGGEVHSVR